MTILMLSLGEEKWLQLWFSLSSFSFFHFFLFTISPSQILEETMTLVIGFETGVLLVHTLFSPPFVLSDPSLLPSSSSPSFSPSSSDDDDDDSDELPYSPPSSPSLSSSSSSSSRQLAHRGGVRALWGLSSSVTSELLRMNIMNKSKKWRRKGGRGGKAGELVVQCYVV